MTLDPKKDPSCVLAFDWGEGSGNTVYDLSQYGNHGTIYGAVRTRGILRYAGSFDGVDDYVEVADSASLRGVGDEITVMAWVNLITLDEGSVLGKWSSWTDGEWLLWSRSADPGEMAFGVVTVNGDAAAYSSVVLKTATWYMLTGVYDGSYVKIYINAKKEGTTSSITGGILSTTNDVYVGGKSYEYLNCLVGSLRIYNRALTEKEIREHYYYGISMLKQKIPSKYVTRPLI